MSRIRSRSRPAGRMPRTPNPAQPRSGFAGGPTSSTPRTLTRTSGSRSRRLTSCRGIEIDAEGLDTDEVFLNIGPQHPSTHGVFRMVVGLQGETVTSLRPVLGHLHRNHEKIGERNLWTGNIPYTDRLDYICPMYNNFGYVVAVERMMGQEVAERAEYLRVINGELARIINHLLGIGFQFNELGAMLTPMIYAFAEREHVLDLWEDASGARMMVNYMRFGGVARDVSDDWLKRCRMVVDRLDRKIDEFDTLLTDNEIFIARSRGVGAMTWQEMVNYGISGPMLRSAGLKYDIRKVEPYSIYDSFDFEVPTFPNGDVYDRYQQRLAEARQSVKILKQASTASLSKVRSRPARRHGTPRCRPGALQPRGASKRRAGLLPGQRWGDESLPLSRPLVLLCQPGGYEAMSLGHLLADAIVILGSVDITLGEVDR